MSNSAVTPTAFYNPIITKWVSYTPTYTGIIASASSVRYRRVGDSIEVFGQTDISSSAAATVSISLPSGLTLDTSKLSGNLSNLFGMAYRGGGSAINIPVAAYGAWAVVDNRTNSTSAVYIASQTNAIFSLVNGNAILSSSEYLSFRFTAPITQWDF